MQTASTDNMDAARDCTPNGLCGLPDEELMMLCASGSGEAFDLLYRRHEKPLCAFINRFLNDYQASEDVTQEVMLRVYRSASEYEARCKFTTWLYRIATNLSLNELRYRRTHQVISLNTSLSMAVGDGEAEDVELQDLMPNPYAECPGRALEAKEEIAGISRAVEGLPDVQRRVLTLYVWNGLKLSEIADELNCSVGTVKSRAHYGLKTVREKLERGDTQDE